MGELMNQIVGSFTVKVGRDLQTHITQNQPKMLALNKQVMLSVDTNLDSPESRRVTFFTARNNIFYLELAMDKTEFIRIHNDGMDQEELDPDALIAQTKREAAQPAWPPPRWPTITTICSIRSGSDGRRPLQMTRPPMGWPRLLVRVGFRSCRADPC